MTVENKLVVNGIEVNVPITVKGEDLVDAVCEHFINERNTLKDEIVSLLGAQDLVSAKFYKNMLNLVNKE